MTQLTEKMRPVPEIEQMTLELYDQNRAVETDSFGFGDKFVLLAIL